jgi:hypothetical protein
MFPNLSTIGYRLLAIGYALSARKRAQRARA